MSSMNKPLPGARGTECSPTYTPTFQPGRAPEASVSRKSLIRRGEGPDASLAQTWQWHLRGQANGNALGGLGAAGRRRSRSRVFVARLERRAGRDLRTP